jgi:hypothetical protein
LGLRLIDPLRAVCYTPGTMLTGRILLYSIVAAPVVLVLVLILYGCTSGAPGEDLVFTEQSDQARQERTEEGTSEDSTVRSNVELSGQEQPHRRLLILPFANATNSSEYDILISGLPQLIQRIFDNDRFVSAETISPDSYAEVAAMHGIGSDSMPGIELARQLHQSYRVDMILCGRIMTVNRNLLIEPKVFMFPDEEGSEEVMGPMAVRPSNFLSFINPLTERIKDSLVDLR